jgi:hypothetical protein
MRLKKRICEILEGSYLDPMLLKLGSVLKLSWRQPVIVTQVKGASVWTVGWDGRQELHKIEDVRDHNLGQPIGLNHILEALRIGKAKVDILQTHSIGLSFNFWALEDVAYWDLSKDLDGQNSKMLKLLNLALK